MIILSFFFILNCSKPKIFFSLNENKTKFIPKSRNDVISSNFSSEFDNLYHDEEDENDEREENYAIDNRETEIIGENISIFELIKEKKINLLISQLPYIEDLSILEEEDENENTFLHTLIKSIKKDDIDERYLIDIIDILKGKDGFNWHKVSKDGSYASLAFKDNMFFPLLSILKKKFEIVNERLSLYVDLIIEKRYCLANECFRLFLDFLSLKQFDEIKVLLKDKLSSCQNTVDEKIILNLIENLECDKEIFLEVYDINFEK